MVRLEELHPEETQTHDPSPSSSSSSTTYDVFLSFRGIDTRNIFVGHLYNALVRDSIRTFKDDKDLKIGEEIVLIFKAIDESRVSIPVFSLNYASSKWCLDELVKIMECRDKKGQTVFPIFYNVAPGDIRNQSGIFGQNFHQLAQDTGDSEKVESWKKALNKAGNLKGWELSKIDDGNEAKLVQLVVKEVWCVLRKTHFDVPEKLVGINSRVTKLLDLLNPESKNAKIVGISGMGGIGKTTIANVVFNQIRHNYDGSAYLENIRETSKQSKDLVPLQNLLLSDILKTEFGRISNVDEGTHNIKKYLQMKKVLIVLDDVDSIKQLEALADRPDWFGPGSIIIITTRDKSVLNKYKEKEKEIYEAEKLDFDDSLCLFKKRAFGKDQPPNDFQKLVEDLVHNAGGLPLALEVLGSSLSHKRTLEEWRNTLAKWKEIPPADICGRLKLSYDGLDDDLDRKIFLDIACFFIGTDMEYATSIWEGCGFHPKVGIENLFQRSLIKFGNYNELRMHDQIRDMGRYIVRQENLEEPGKRTRLWSLEDVLDVLDEQAGSGNVEGIATEFEGNHIRTEAFGMMSKLRLLRLDKAHLEGDFKMLPSKIRWLSWKGCHLDYISTDFCLRKLSVLDLSGSRIKEVWNDVGQKEFPELKVLILSGCLNLAKTPDFSRLPNLERLNLAGCKKLQELQSNICKLKSLKTLNLSWCSNLCNFPDLRESLEKLEVLDLSWCEQLMETPDFSRLPNLKRLNLRGCKKLVELQSSICKLRSLKNLDLSSCSNLNKFPDLGESLEELKVLDLGRCERITNTPDFCRLLNLEILNLEGCKKLEELRYSVCKLKYLKDLNLSGCSKLRNFPDLDESLEALTDLNLSECQQLTKTPDLSRFPNLEILDLEGCVKLEEIPGSICKLRSLRNFNLSGCSKLSNFPDLDESLEALTDLNLSECQQLTKAPDFTRLPNLERLNLKGCVKLEEIPGSVCKLKSIRNFNLSGCSKFGKFPDLDESLEALTDLNLSECQQLTKAPDFTRLPNLERLNLEGCVKLEEIPGSIWNIKSLKRLILSGCSNLMELPDSCVPVQELKEIKVDDCKLLRRLPDSIGSMVNLKKLFLDGTSIKELPNAVGWLEKMEFLSVKRCRNLVKLPDSMGKMNLLRRLRIDKTGIVKLPEDFGMLSRLTKLSMSDCRVDTLPISFSGLRSLEYLDASKCNISEGGILCDFCNLSSLMDLRLSYNKFSSLPASIIALRQLGFLELKNCRNLQCLPEMPSSLWGLRINDCISLESLPDLHRLQDLDISNCEQLSEMGLEEMKSLERLWMSGCSRALVNSTKKSLGQLMMLQRLGGFTYPGSDIPDCCTPVKVMDAGDVFRIDCKEALAGLAEQHQRITASLVLCFVFTNEPHLSSPIKVSLVWDCGLTTTKDITATNRHQDQIFFEQYPTCYHPFYVGEEMRLEIGPRQAIEIKKAGLAFLSREESTCFKRRMGDFFTNYYCGSCDEASNSSSSTRKRKFQLLDHVDDDHEEESSAAAALEEDISE